MIKLSLFLVASAAIAVQANPTPYNLDAISNAALHHNWNEVGRIVDHDVNRRFNLVTSNQHQPENYEKYQKHPRSAYYRQEGPEAVNHPGVYTSTSSNGASMAAASTSDDDGGHVYGIRTNIIRETTYENGRPVVHSYGHEDVYEDGKVRSYDFTPK